MTRIEDLPYDIFPLIFQHVPNRSTVYNACLVCKTFAEVSTPSLYSTLTLWAVDWGLEKGPWPTIVAKPQYAEHVLYLHIVPQARAQRDTTSELGALLPRLINLRALKILTPGRNVFEPYDYTSTFTFLSSLLFRNSRRLRALTFAGHFQWTDPFSPFQHFSNVRHVTICGFDRTLWGLPRDDTHRFATDSTSHHIDQLSQLALTTAQHVESFEIEGHWAFSRAQHSMLYCLSKMTNLIRLDLTKLRGTIPMSELLPVVLKLRCLEHLSLVYLHDERWVAPEIPQQQSLPRLSSFTVAFRDVEIRADFDRLWLWILNFTKYCTLRHLVVRPLAKNGCKIRKAMKACITTHKSSLRTLRLEYTVIAQNDLRALLIELPDLVEFAFSANKGDIVKTFTGDRRAETLSLEKLDMRFHAVGDHFNSNDAARLMDSIPRLRHLAVNDYLWERYWLRDEDGNVYRDVTEPVKFRTEKDLLF
ncbi:hypothetical protein EXIGLDRAFT_754317 [Exidia glandulosa HHB12029]|uniref:F-box domain-containing protein n=1 Tax=Exidia glandulosa HHB12029 TaxID=1314781 RepID=A0A165D0D2_EXIGL|nr:hypothetical protein EXIGLDRAFT_754317 [Exidia glandulosa HHB12029]